MKRIIMVVVVLSLIIGVILGAVPVAGADIDDGLIALYHMDEGSGSTITDSVGTNDGTIYGASWAYGKYCNGLSFDGDDDYFVTSNNIGISGNASRTIACWFNQRESQEGVIVSFGEISGSVDGALNALMIRPGDNQWGFYGGDADCYLTSDFPSLNTWHHLVMTYDGTTVKLYLDNVLKKSCNRTLNAIDTQLSSGARLDYSPPKFYFNGFVDEIAIYNRALSDSEVADLFSGALVDTDGDGEGDACDPVANAGPNQTLEQTSYEGADVIIDGSASYDPNGDPLAYNWTWDGKSVSGVIKNITLPLGTTTVTLEVSNGKYTDTDTVDITVQDTTPPEVSITSPEHLETYLNIGKPIPINYTATDICDPELNITITLDGRLFTGDKVDPIVIADGKHVLVVTATDDSDNEASASISFIIGIPGCFIATAAYGTPMAKEIEIMRQFRDEYLLTNLPGQAFVDFYYKVSPPIAEFITEHPSLKPVVRAVLIPAVTMSTIVVNTILTEKMTIIGLMMLVSAALATWIVRRRGSTDGSGSI